MTNEKSRAVLEVLRSDEKIAWIVGQLIASFSEGLTLSARDATSVGHDLIALTPPERTRRQKHEISRPYDEKERIELVRFALKEVFVALPRMQVASAKALKEFGSLASSIEFTAPDEEAQVEEGYTRDLVRDLPSVEDLQRRFDDFSQRLVL